MSAVPDREDEDGQWKEEQKLEAHSDWVRDVAWAPSIGLPTSTIASCSQVALPHPWDSPLGRWPAPAEAGMAVLGWEQRGPEQVRGSDKFPDRSEGKVGPWEIYLS